MDIKKIIASSPAFIVPSAINLASIVVFTRSLTLENYGKLSLALITIEFVQGLFYQWIKLSMMRFFSVENKHSQIAGMQYNTATSVLLLMAVGIAYLANTFLHTIDTTYFAIVTLGIIGRGLCYYLQDYVRISDSNLTKYTWIALSSNGSFYVFGIAYVLAVKNPSVENILWWQLAGVFMFLGVYLVYSFKFIRQHMADIIRGDIYRQYLKYGLPLVGAFLATSMFIRVDRYIIELTSGLKELGSYSAAFSLAQLATTSFFMILTLPTYPEIIRKMNEGDVVSAKKIFKGNGNIILSVGVPVVVICCILNQPLCHLFFGAKGSQISFIFPFVVVGAFLYNFKLHYFDQVFQFAKRTNVIMVLGLIIGIGHLALSHQLGRQIGSRGVAISSIGFNLASMIFIYYYSKSFFEISFNRRVFIGVVALGVIVFSCQFFLTHAGGHGLMLNTSK